MHSWTRQWWPQCLSYQGVVSTSRSLSALSRCRDSHETVETSGEVDVRKEDTGLRVQGTSREKKYRGWEPVEKQEISRALRKYLFESLAGEAMKREGRSLREHLQDRWCWRLLGAAALEGKGVETKWMRYCWWWLFCGSRRRHWVSEKA